MADNEQPSANVEVAAVHPVAAKLVKGRNNQLAERFLISTDQPFVLSALEVVPSPSIEGTLLMFPWLFPLTLKVDDEVVGQLDRWFRAENNSLITPVAISPPISVSAAQPLELSVYTDVSFWSGGRTFAFNIIGLVGDKAVSLDAPVYSQALKVYRF